MKQLEKTFLLISFFILSCASAQHIGSYGLINVFLEYKKLDKNKQYILVRDKELNKQVLRIFNGNEGSQHLVDTTVLIILMIFLWRNIGKRFMSNMQMIQ